MKASVALCCFNGEKYIAQQIKSVLKQTVRVTEMIICDDKSTDNTWQIINHFSKQYPAVIKIYENDETLGVVKNFSKAMSLCTGDVIFLADQDDVWVPSKVQQCLSYFDQHPRMEAVISDAVLIDANGLPLEGTMWEKRLFKNLLDNTAFDLHRFMILYRNMVTGACLAIKRDALLELLPLPVMKNMLHDEYIGLMLAKQGKLGIIQSPLVEYRIHDSQQSKRMWQVTASQQAVMQSIFKNDITKHAVHHYTHWKKRMLYLKCLTIQGLPVPHNFFSEVKDKRKQALIQCLQSKSIVLKKWSLLLLWIKKKEGISFLDFLKV